MRQFARLVEKRLASKLIQLLAALRELAAARGFAYKLRIYTLCFIFQVSLRPPLTRCWSDQDDFQ